MKKNITTSSSWECNKCIFKKNKRKEDTKRTKGKEDRGNEVIFDSPDLLILAALFLCYFW